MCIRGHLKIKGGRVVEVVGFKLVLLDANLFLGPVGKSFIHVIIVFVRLQIASDFQSIGPLGRFFL